MSEPMTNAEIEDVLSSIRRLVSQDLRPKPVPAPPSAPAAMPMSSAPQDAPLAASAPDKLILTPALRIVAEGEAAQVQAATIVSSVGAAMGAQDWETEEAIPAVPEAAMAFPDWSDDSPGFQPETGHPQAEVIALHPESSPEGDLAGAQEAAVMTFSSVRAAAAQPDMTSEDEAGPDAEDRIETGAEAVVEADVEADVEPEAEADVEADVEADQDLSRFVTLDDDGFVARNETVHEATIEPDADWAAAAEADVLAELARDQAAEAELSAAYQSARTARSGPAEEADEDFGEMRFDEEILRSLVQDIIKEEFQGPMGERITRNIRKLVRAEIARALSTQDVGA